MMDKKSSIYSDRPILHMGGELVGWKNTLVLVPYGDRFRNYRRLFHQLIGSNGVMAQFHPIEELETHRFLKRLLSRPQALAEHVRKTAGAIILRISHGYEVRETDDPFVSLADLATEQFSLSTAPGGFLVNLVPALRHLPDWFPGAGFKKTASAWAATLNSMIEGPHQFVKQQMAEGAAEVSFTSSLLEEPGLTPEREFDIKWSAGSLYSGGADTTVSSIYAFFKAMTLYPEVQAKAQAELDAVIGNDRLPSFHDRDNLPYCNALVLEVLRWHAVVPTGVPHRVSEDNIYEGYLIPKDALVIPNIWRILHDPKVYSDPMKFKPERFLGPTPEPDPRNVCFGFGRRICPGRVLADASIFISVTMSLAVFDISKHSENGKVIEPVVEQTPGTISHPTPFLCSINPRSEKTRALINSEERQ
ncbi:cytochrome P450 [Cyathus striatus]|nr:cytochrome P450 [Cyathus striatus]